MLLGAISLQNEIGKDPGAVRILRRDRARARLRPHPGRRWPGWDGAQDSTSQFHEPFVLFGFLAAVTSGIELATVALILGQRQAAEVALSPRQR